MVLNTIFKLFFAAAALSTAASPALAQGLTDEQRAARWATENELQSLAIVERKVVLTMRDGIRIPADIYRPRDSSKRYPTIWVRTPYNFNYWDVNNGVPRDMSAALRSVKHGYVHVDMQERGHFFAEGNWDILGPPLTDGEDELEWLTSQPWVQRSGRHDRVFVDRGMAAGRRVARSPRLRGDERAGLWRWCGARGPVL